MRPIPTNRTVRGQLGKFCSKMVRQHRELIRSASDPDHRHEEWQLTLKALCMKIAKLRLPGTSSSNSARLQLERCLGAAGSGGRPSVMMSEGLAWLGSSHPEATPLSKA